MCGICGIYAVNGEPARAEEILAQSTTLIHRGPDQDGLYIAPDGQCGLGIRRLSIIDVAGGRQPLQNETGSAWLVYNGETYNHRELRDELERLGHRPATYSDGEVILHGYEAWGAAGVLSRLRGMFAFALWDEGQQQLLLARDRFGIKPLYYARHAGRLYFASEIKAILAQPDFPRRTNPAALEAMLTLGFVPGPATMFEGIYKLPPAHFLLARPGVWSIQPYWRLSYSQTSQISLDEAAEGFLELLAESVRLRRMSEVPLGALLSGGLDSSTVVALLQAGLRQEGLPAAGPLQTVSIGFEQAVYDETGPAWHMAKFAGTRHHQVTFTQADFNDYPTVMKHLEEPQGAATALPIYKLYRACREAGLTVVLTGEGADELLGGYHWHQGDAALRLLLGLPAGLRRFLAASPLPMSAPARRVLRLGARDTASRYQHWLALESGGFRQRLLSAGIRRELESNGAGNPLLSGWQERLGYPAADSPLHQALWLETQTRLADFINFEVDRMSMAHSIEARVPFLDHKLWEFCAGRPAHFKLRPGGDKLLLRQVTQRLLPEATRTRRKKGLAAPYADWLRSSRLPDWAEAALDRPAIDRASLFAPNVVAELRRAHQAGRPQLGPLLMAVLSTQLWVECFGVQS